MLCGCKHNALSQSVGGGGGLDILSSTLSHLGFRTGCCALHDYCHCNVVLVSLNLFYPLCLGILQLAEEKPMPHQAGSNAVVRSSPGSRSLPDEETPVGLDTPLVSSSLAAIQTPGDLAMPSPVVVTPEMLEQLLGVRGTGAHFSIVC